MDGHHAPLSSTARSLHTDIWTNGVLYLVLKHANLPPTLTDPDRVTMQAGIRRVLDAMLAELESVDAGATERLKQTIHGLAEVLDDARTS